MDKVECTVCGADVGRLGIGKHAKMHRRQFKEQFGYWPTDYDEVREKLRGTSEANTTLDEF